jgi:hypothetical protein
MISLAAWQISVVIWFVIGNNGQETQMAYFSPPSCVISAYMFLMSTLRCKSTDAIDTFCIHGSRKCQSLNCAYDWQCQTLRSGRTVDHVIRVLLFGYVTCTTIKLPCNECFGYYYLASPNRCLISAGEYTQCSSIRFFPHESRTW